MAKGFASAKQQLSNRQCNNDNPKQYIYVCITTNQPDTISNPNLNPTTKQHASVNVQLNIVTCPAYPAKFTRDNVVAPFVQTSVVIATLPKQQSTVS